MGEADELSLPEFDRPPVVETVLSIQFEAIPGLSTVHFGLFWERIRDRFPRTEVRPAVEPVLERFGEKRRRAPRIRLEARENPGPERMWFVNRPGTEMIQLQVDRFIKNWRKRKDGDAYPRYEKVIKPGFEKDLMLFEEFLVSQDLPALTVNQCEVTYVNHIVAGEGWQSWSEMKKIFSFLGAVPAGTEDGVFMLRIPIEHVGTPIGRVTAEIQPATRDSDDVPMYAFTLTARGMVGTGLDFLDIGREALAKRFIELTTPEMHVIWGRRK